MFKSIKLKLGGVYMRNKLLTVFFLALILMLAQGCGSSSDGETKEDVEIDEENFNETGMPIVNEPIELNFFAGHSPIDRKSVV